MSDLYKNPEKEPQTRDVKLRLNDPGDWSGTRMNIAGPAGKTTNLEHDEKGILESDLFEVMAFHQEASLPSSRHDVHAQGIYRSTDGKYSD